MHCRAVINTCLKAGADANGLNFHFGKKHGIAVSRGRAIRQNGDGFLISPYSSVGKELKIAEVIRNPKSTRLAIYIKDFKAGDSVSFPPGAYILMIAKNYGLDSTTRK